MRPQPTLEPGRTCVWSGAAAAWGARAAAGECAAGAPAGCRRRGSTSSSAVGVVSIRQRALIAGPAERPVRAFPKLGAARSERADQDGRVSLTWLSDCASAAARRSRCWPCARPVRGAARPARARRRSARSRSARCRRSGSTRLRAGRRSDLREPGPHEQSHRYRGCWPGAGLLRPSPRWAPATSPPMSWKAIVSGTTFDALTVCATASSRGSATGTTATLGSIVVVVNG
jgi:hypothetical protein